MSGRVTSDKKNRKQKGDVENNIRKEGKVIEKKERERKENMNEKIPKYIEKKDKESERQR